MSSINSWKYFYLEQNLFLYKDKLVLIRILSKPLSNDDEGRDDHSTTIIDNCTYQKVFLKKLFYKQSMIFLVLFYYQSRIPLIFLVKYNMKPQEF